MCSSISLILFFFSILFILSLIVCVYLFIFRAHLCEIKRFVYFEFHTVCIRRLVCHMLLFPLDWIHFKYHPLIEHFQFFIKFVTRKQLTTRTRKMGTEQNLPLISYFLAFHNQYRTISIRILVSGGPSLYPLRSYGKLRFQ